MQAIYCTTIIFLQGLLSGAIDRWKYKYCVFKNILPPAESISESETWVMEKREIGDGDTVKRENCTTGLLSVALGGKLGLALLSGGDSSDEVGSGSKEKSSSHSYPVPAHKCDKENA